MKKQVLTYRHFGDAAILIEWSPQIVESTLKDITLFHQKIQQNKCESIVEVVRSIHALAIIYTPELTNFDSLKAWLENLYFERSSLPASDKNHLWKIPVCYDFRFGLDLLEISNGNGLSVENIIEIHTNTIYLIYSMGFLPGFVYLGGLDERLHIPRKPIPRLEVVKGAVGIGGEQTGVYPCPSPGGWQIIGNTPIPFFEVAKDIPCFSKPGDKIQFVPISFEEYKALELLILSDTFLIEKEVIGD